MLTYVRTAATPGTAVPDGERAIWQRLSQLGQTTPGHGFAQQGTGDPGDAAALPDGPVRDRLPQLPTRRYVSIVGEFTLARTAAGSREEPKSAFVPRITAGNCRRRSSPLSCKTGAKGRGRSQHSDKPEAPWPACRT